MQAQHLKPATPDATDPAHAEGSTVQIAGKTTPANRYSLLQTLTVIDALKHGPMMQHSLRRQFGIDQPCLLHHLREARHMGADLAPFMMNGKGIVILHNWPQVEATVTRWIELETKRDLRI